MRARARNLHEQAINQTTRIQRIGRETQRISSARSRAAAAASQGSAGAILDLKGEFLHLLMSFHFVVCFDSQRHGIVHYSEASSFAPKSPRSLVVLLCLVLSDIYVVGTDMMRQIYRHMKQQPDLVRRKLVTCCAAGAGKYASVSACVLFSCAANPQTRFSV